MILKNLSNITIYKNKNNHFKIYYNSLKNRISNNYYPISSFIYIENKNQSARLAVLNDRSQGGSSLHNGEIELNINRKVLSEDDKGNLNQSIQIIFIINLNK